MFWGLLLILLGLMLLAMEVFIPSAGLLLLLALTSLVTGVVVVFFTPESEGGGMRAGLITMLLLVLLSPLLAGLALYVWPRTPFAKRLRLDAPDTATSFASAGFFSNLEQFRGQIGRTLTPHMPSGQIEIAGHRLESTSAAGPIEAGQLVKVVAVENNYLLVRSISEADTSVPKELDLPEDLLS